MRPQAGVSTNCSTPAVILFPTTRPIFTARWQREGNRESERHLLSFYDARRLTASLRSLSSPPPPLRHPVISLRGHVLSCVLPITSLRRTAIGSGEGGLMVFSSGSDVVADAVAAAAAAAAAADGEPTARPSLRKSACRRHLPPFPVSAKDSPAGAAVDRSCRRPAVPQNGWGRPSRRAANIYSPFRLQTTDIMVTQPSTCLRLSDNTAGAITWWRRLTEEFCRNPLWLSGHTLA